MYRPLPPIAESADELKHRLQRDHDGRRRPRLQMLYLLRSGQAHSRVEVAQLLGVGRNTVARWLAAYAAGGLPALLQVYVPAGKRPSLSPDVLASLEAALHAPAGFASYKALQAWLAQTHGVQIKYKTLYALVRKHFGTKLKVPRPSHIKKARGRRRLSGHLYRPGTRQHSTGEHTPGESL